MTAEIGQPREIPLDSPEHWARKQRFRASGIKETFILATESLELDSIPQAGRCGLCGGREQTEWVEFSAEFDRLKVVAFPGIPGYGCRDCGEKGLDESALSGFLKVASNEFRSVGDETKAERLEMESSAYTGLIINPS